MSARVLVAGIGNIFFGDDGFGVEVANRLTGQTVAPGVRVADFGIQGLHLAYELLEGYDVLVLVDAVPMGEAPGTLAVIEPDLSVFASGDGDPQQSVVDAHSMNPSVVLATLASLGGRVERVVVVGCEPGTTEGIGLSDAVSAAVDPAVDLCHRVLEDLSQISGRETTA